MLASCDNFTSEANPEEPLDSTGLPGPPRAHAQFRYPPSACVSNHTGAPVGLIQGRPIVGFGFSVAWFTVPTSPPAPPAPEIMFLMVSPVAAPEPEPLDRFGMPGCWLQVPPDNIVFPAPGTGVTQDGGTLTLNMPVLPHMTGLHLFVQCGILDPLANYGGALVSPVLELTFGM